MSNKKFLLPLMALAAMSFSLPSYSQEKAFSPKIKTQDTGADLVDSAPATTPSVQEPKAIKEYPLSSAPRRLQRHGLGLGVGQTFLLGGYGKHGDSSITADLLYSYAASYSFDLLVNAHFSQHKDDNERMKLLGTSAGIKARLVEYDNFSPYVVGGVGFYAPRAKRQRSTGTEWSSQKVTFGVNFGAGVDLRLNEEWVVGLLAQLHAPFVVEQDGQKDLRGYYAKLMFTGMYQF